MRLDGSSRITSNGVKVFLTGGGGAGTIPVIESLVELGYEVITGDASEFSAGFVKAHRGFIIPFGIEPGFEASIRQILREEHPDFVVPLVDEEIPIIHRLVKREFPQTRVVAPNLRFCEDMLDKWVMYERLQAANLPVARTWLASNAGDAIYPAIIKPRTGRGSRGLAYLSDASALSQYLSQIPTGHDQYIVQERAIGVEYTTSAVVGLDGGILCVVPKEVISKRGITQLGATRSNAAIERLCVEIQERLGANGPFNVQLILTSDGEPVVFEINPRYSTTVALTLAAGVNEVNEVIRRERGEQPLCLKFVPDLLMVRYMSQLFAPESAWAPSDRRAPETPGQS